VVASGETERKKLRKKKRTAVVRVYYYMTRRAGDMGSRATEAVFQDRFNKRWRVRCCRASSSTRTYGDIDDGYTRPETTAAAAARRGRGEKVTDK